MQQAAACSSRQQQAAAGSSRQRELFTHARRANGLPITLLCLVPSTRRRSTNDERGTTNADDMRLLAEPMLAEAEARAKDFDASSEAGKFLKRLVTDLAATRERLTKPVGRACDYNGEGHAIGSPLARRACVKSTRCQLLRAAAACCCLLLPDAACCAAT